MYPSDALRVAARQKQFAQMDRESKGYITLEQVRCKKIIDSSWMAGKSKNYENFSARC